MTDSGPDELDVRLEWSEPGGPGAGPVELAWSEPASGDDGRAAPGTARRGIRLRPGSNRLTSALRAEVDELRTEVERLRIELDALRAGLERSGEVPSELD